MAQHHMCTLISYFTYFSARAVLRSPSVSYPYITALPIGSCSTAASIPTMLHMQSLRLHRPLQVLSGAWRAAGSHPPRKQASMAARCWLATMRYQADNTRPIPQGATAHQQRASNMAASSTSEAGAAIAARQAELFSRPDTIQEFLAPLPEDITQVGEGAATVRSACTCHLLHKSGRSPARPLPPLLSQRWCLNMAHQLQVLVTVT
jgi:hypothetical protein